jgi:predicted permease
MIAQVAISLVLLLGAGLLARSFQKLCAIDPGVEEQVLEMALQPRRGSSGKVDMIRYRRQLMERIGGVPSVLSAGFSDFAGPGSGGWQDEVSTMANVSNPGAGVRSDSIMVSPGFLRTLGIGLTLGRDFDWTDDARHPHVAIISANLAARLFPSGGALGQRIRFGFMPEMQDLEIVGVARSIRLVDLRDAAAPVVYLPYAQYPQWAARGSTDLFVRSARDPAALARAVGREIESFGQEYPLNAKTLGQRAGEALAADRVVMLLSGFFASLALLLASIGLYGLTSYAVTRRTREIGIRTALGAQPAAVRWGVLRDALVLALAGIAIGIPCALAASRLLAGMLFGVSPADLPTIAFVSVSLLAVALLASYLPARRASRIDPMAALRAE